MSTPLSRFVRTWPTLNTFRYWQEDKQGNQYNIWNCYCKSRRLECVVIDHDGDLIMGTGKTAAEAFVDACERRDEMCTPLCDLI